MKTKTFPRIITGALFLAIILVCSIRSQSQQLITFTNGSTLKVNIVYQTKDTIRYYKEGNPDVIYSESMDRVEKIIPAENLNIYRPGPVPKSAPLTTDKEFWKYKKGTTTGGVLMGTGALLTLAGLGWSASNDADTPNEVLGAVFSVMGMSIGSALFITGGIITIVNASNLATYRKEHPGISVNLKSNRGITGVSLVYNF